MAVSSTGGLKLAGNLTPLQGPCQPCKLALSDLVLIVGIGVDEMPQNGSIEGVEKGSSNRDGIMELGGALCGFVLESDSV